MSTGQEDTQVYDALDYPSELTPASEYVTFGLHGRTYKIELSKAHVAQLQNTLAPYIARAYHSSGTERHRLVGDVHPSEHNSQSRMRRARNVAIRNWAAERGYELSPQGRIPDEVVQEFELSNHNNEE